MLHYWSSPLFLLMLLIPTSPARVGCYIADMLGFILEGKHISISELGTSNFFFLSMLSMERKLSEGGILITCRLFFNFRVKLNCVPGFTLMGNFLLQS